jgi:hypothetical protein
MERKARKEYEARITVFIANNPALDTPEFNDLAQKAWDATAGTKPFIPLVIPKSHTSNPKVISKSSSRNLPVTIKSSPSEPGREPRL